MNTDLLDYHLPQDLIAQQPAEQRHQSRLLHVSRSTGAIEHHQFDELPTLLRPGDLLVLNDTRVVPARIDLQRATGGEIEGLFLQALDDGRWKVMLRGRGRIKPGELLRFRQRPEQALRLLSNDGEGLWTTLPEPLISQPLQLLEDIGRMPLPPYIRRSSADSPDIGQADLQRYQTTYARTPGAVAAPTAGLHFTPQLLADLRERDIDHCFVTLHVGIGTFRPVVAEQLEDHVMHSEFYRLTAPAAEAIQHAVTQGRRIVAVGTTSVRVLETIAARTAGVAGVAGTAGAAGTAGGHPWQACEGWTNIFIYPPYQLDRKSVV